MFGSEQVVQGFVSPLPPPPSPPVRRLLSEGVSSSIANADGLTPLHRVSMSVCMHVCVTAYICQEGTLNTGVSVLNACPPGLGH